ncbi:MAG TPA: hypothetical protein VNO50_15060 [Pyrinomonadaceae bacterium]|nr:hypothetical protein [Pyrinomonadaceae bacterium]
MRAKYTRLYSDSSGESHFEDVEAELTEVQFAPPAPPLSLSEFLPAIQTAFLGAPAGWRGDWHVSSARNWFVVISGAWEIEASDGAKRVFSSTETLLAEDITGKGHKSRVLGDEDSLALLVQLDKLK